MVLDRDTDIKAVREWCVTNGVTTATINSIIYRGRIHHFEANMSADDLFLFRLRWS